MSPGSSARSLALASRPRCGAYASLARVAAGNPIAQVALSCGFADQSHLTKAVRKVTGRTPGGWRRELK